MIGPAAAGMPGPGPGPRKLYPASLARANSNWLQCRLEDDARALAKQTSRRAGAALPVPERTGIRHDSCVCCGLAGSSVRNPAQDAGTHTLCACFSARAPPHNAMLHAAYAPAECGCVRAHLPPACCCMHVARCAQVQKSASRARAARSKQ